MEELDRAAEKLRCEIEEHWGLIFPSIRDFNLECLELALASIRDEKALGLEAIPPRVDGRKRRKRKT